MLKVKCTEFVKRQTAESPFSHFIGSWEVLAEIAETVLPFHERVRPGYRDGVLLVDVPATMNNGRAAFWCGVIALSEASEIVAEFKARRDGELPTLNVTARGPKAPAKRCDLVLYSAALLRADGEIVPDGIDYMIVSINARVQDDPEPMTPAAMARNFLGQAGGTPATYTAEEFARSIDYWNRHAMCSTTK